MQVSGNFEAHVLLFIGSRYYGADNFELKEDRCGPHWAKTIAKYLNYNFISRIKWHKNITDLNPIENV